jgi:glycerol-3-phosphate dehydrogenase
VTERPYDVAIVGAGVVGAAIARELARYELACVLLEASSDVGAGTSKANTALLHTGFDAKPGSLEARLVHRGHDLLEEYAAEAGIPLERTGALLVAWNADQLAQLEVIEQNAHTNGYEAGRRVSVDEIYRLEPHLASGALGALEIPGESIICAFTTPLAFATQAVVNGVELRLDSALIGRSTDEEGLNVLVLAGGREVSSRYVVNAAGLHSDEVNQMFGHDGFTVVPRRGELIVFDKGSRQLVSRILLPVPTAKTKGMLVAPTVFGNLMVGPTADDIEDKAGTESTPAGTRALMDKGRTLVPALMDEEVTAVYAGLRAATEHSDYQIALHAGDRYVCVGGIRSTGLSASMAIAEHVAELLAEAELELKPKESFETVRMPNIGEAFVRPYCDAQAIEANPDYGRIVCHCERVTAGEMLDACRAVIPARSLDGLRRRTRASMGRCQGFYCAARVLELLSRSSGRSPGELAELEGQ